MTVLTDDDWYADDEYWEGFTDEAFLEYLAGYPEPSVHDGYEYDVSDESWPTSIERRSYFYNGGC